MESRFLEEEINNVFKSLNDECSKNLIGLCIAANDLIANGEVINNFPLNESNYFFYNSISILRELAKLVSKIHSSNMLKNSSENTLSVFRKFNIELAQFHDESFAKSILKPIRDATFHYDLSEWVDKTHVEQLLSKLNHQEIISVGFIPNEKSLLAQRYTFAENYRSEYINKFLSTDNVNKIVTITVNVVEFIDSFIADIINTKKIESPVARK